MTDILIKNLKSATILVIILWVYRRNNADICQHITLVRAYTLYYSFYLSHIIKMVVFLNRRLLQKYICKELENQNLEDCYMNTHWVVATNKRACRNIKNLKYNKFSSQLMHGIKSIVFIPMVVLVIIGLTTTTTAYGQVTKLNYRVND